MRWPFRRNKVKETPLMIWGVIEGPFHVSEIEEGEERDEMEWMMVMKVSRGGKVGHSQVWFDTYEQAYSMKSYFDNNFEPLTVGVQNE